MKYFFIFAHPDDETVACSGTIKQLIDHGDEVIVVSVTDGAAGQIHQRAQARYEALGSVGEVRREELKRVSSLMNVTKLHILDFADGQITNEQVWGKLTSKCCELLELYRPDVVITFDHSGWYFHLDHVGVSIAVTRAVQTTKYPPSALLLSHFRIPNNSKWKYIYHDHPQLTHVVDVTADKKYKMELLNAHTSQDLDEPKKLLAGSKPHFEIYQLAIATAKGKKLFANHPIFRVIS